MRAPAMPGSIISNIGFAPYEGRQTCEADALLWPVSLALAKDACTARQLAGNLQLPCRPAPYRHQSTENGSVNVALAAALPCRETQ